MPKSIRIKRSHYSTDIEYWEAMCTQRAGDTEGVYLNRCKRADEYMRRKGQPIPG